MMENTGKILIAAGILLIIIGLILYYFGARLSWIGHLPGDIRIEKENFRFYFPVTTMILISIVLSVIIWLVKRI